MCENRFTIALYGSDVAIRLGCVGACGLRTLFINR